MVTKIYLTIFLLAIFKLSVLAQVVPNSSFENWVSASNDNYIIPEYWESPTEQYISFYIPHNHGMKQSNEAHSGAYSVKLNSVDLNDVNGTDEGYASMIQSTFSVEMKHERFAGYYKSDLLSGDTATVGVFIYENGNQIGSGAFEIYGNQNTFTHFEAPIGYQTENPQPDEVQFMAISSKFISTFKSGSIWIDDLMLDDIPLNVLNRRNNNQGTVVSAGPNPTSGRFTVWFMAEETGTHQINIYDLLGTRIHAVQFRVQTPGAQRKDIDFPADANNGIYIYELANDNKRFSNRITLRR